MKTVMTDTAIAAPPTTNKHLIRWVEKMAELTQPNRIHWIDGSEAEYDFLCDQLIKAGGFTQLRQKLWPGGFLPQSSPDDLEPWGGPPFHPSGSEVSSWSRQTWGQ